MTESASSQRMYAPGHSESELDRLSRQAQAFEPFTRQLFEEAGIAPGMRVLDVGSGSGDVAFLAARLVGPAGAVVGTDQASEAINRARARARAKGIANVTFHQGDPAEAQFDQLFDAVVGRLVLMYYADPGDTLRKLARHLRPGGVLVFQEFDICNARSVPQAPTFQRAANWIKLALNTTGARTQLGLELYSLFVDAGMPGPTMRIDAAIGGGPDFPVYEMTVDVVKTLLPVIEKLKISTAAEIDLPTLAQRMQDEVLGSNGIVLSPALIGAWSRKP